MSSATGYTQRERSGLSRTRDTILWNMRNVPGSKALRCNVCRGFIEIWVGCGCPGLQSAPDVGRPLAQPFTGWHLRLSRFAVSMPGMVFI